MDTIESPAELIFMVTLVSNPISMKGHQIIPTNDYSALVDQGLIIVDWHVPDGQSPAVEATAKGKAYVAHLLNVRIPSEPRYDFGTGYDQSLSHHAIR